MLGAVCQLAPAAADALRVPVPCVHPARGAAPVGVHPDLRSTVQYSTVHPDLSSRHHQQASPAQSLAHLQPFGELAALGSDERGLNLFFNQPVLYKHRNI